MPLSTPLRYNRAPLRRLYPASGSFNFASFGDSISAGWLDSSDGSVAGEGYQAKLARLLALSQPLPVSEFRSAVVGQTAAQAYTQAQIDILTMPASMRHVILELGSNDARLGTDQSTFQTALQNLITLAHNKWPTALIWVCYPWWSVYAAASATVAGWITTVIGNNSSFARAGFDAATDLHRGGFDLSLFASSDATPYVHPLDKGHWTLAYKLWRLTGYAPTPAAANAGFSNLTANASFIALTNSLAKVGGAVAYDTGALTSGAGNSLVTDGRFSTATPALTADGQISLKVHDTAHRLIWGLGTTDNAGAVPPINFAIQAVNDGTLGIYESNNYRGSFGSYTASDVLSIRRTNGLIEYLKNSTVIYTSLVAINNSMPTLYGNFALGDPGSQVDNVQITAGY